MRTMHALTLLAIAGSAAAVSAQDSTGTAPGLPGDAINPLAADQQILSYVADLTPFGTSWGTTFGIVPLVKGVKTDPQFFNNFIGANGISDDLVKGVPFASSQYALWTEAPGVGVNPAANSDAFQLVSPSGSSSQFAVAMANSLGDVLGLGANIATGDTITTAIVNYNPAEPNRLYVTRVEAASSVNGDATGSSGDLAFGSVDGNGNTYFRGGSFRSGGAGVTAQVSNNWYRARAQDRTGGVNLISGTGGAEATDHLLVAQSTPHPQPSNIPASVAGGNGLVAGANFNSQFVRGAAAPLTADTTHFGPTAGGFTPPDHRGQMGTTTRDLFQSGVAHTAVASKDPASDTRVFSVWATDASGAVTEAHSFETPLTVVDPTDGKTVTYIPGSSEYRQYVGITGFRSDAGMVALGQDAAGNGYAAGVMSEFGQSFDLFQQMLSVRFDDNGGNEAWSIIAWVDGVTNSGKAILDGPGGNQIGTLVPFATAFPTAGEFGPSMSTPTFDGAGNAWFLASAALEKTDPVTGDPFIDFDTVLIRGVLTDTGAGSFGYELELVLELGRTFFGQNSGRRYQIQFIDTVAASGDSGLGVSAPAAINSNNGRSWGWDDSDLSGVSNADPITNGGVVLVADIVYDVNEDGEYNDPTSGNGDPASPDQSYQSLLYIGYYAEGPQQCNAADLSEPFGILDLSDINAFVSGFLTQNPISDLDNNGIFDLTDISLFIAAFTAGCP
jgi:hypothetical protein